MSSEWKDPMGDLARAAQAAPRNYDALVRQSVPPLQDNSAACSDQQCPDWQYGEHTHDVRTT